MADLFCIPRNVTLGCGSTTRVTVRTSDKKANITIRTLGYDGDVASISPEEGTTNDMGFVDFVITCAGISQGCPASTTVTFFAVDYDDDDLEVKCVDRDRPADAEGSQIPLAFALTPLIYTPQSLANQLQILQNFGLAENDSLRNE